MRARFSARRRWTWALAFALVAVLGAALALRGEAGDARNAPASSKHLEQAPVGPGGDARASSSNGATATPQAEPAATEEQLIERLRIEAEDHPAAAVSLADESERQFPDGRHAEERAYLKMRALVHLGDIVAAREAAERFFERHPHSAFGRYVFRLTGMRPRPGPGT